ncbi:cyclic nucleotide-gated ion channel 1-like [Pyrus x bretschneideri]|uniref:cyclic nucleotide-gated ion channel 1-like n=1 Tax=Pyrus x bretschneideri TaxID=225117 RepID=UPI00202E0DD4|nr:cyclic nucleotide-gated ion channel 1-like [Pyrus x bretschneideri]
MRKSDEPVPQTESSDESSIDLASLSGEIFLELAKGKYGKRDGGNRSTWSIQCDRNSIQRAIQSILFGIGCLFVIMIYFGPMLVDPLFLYVPIINENIKCLALDEKLKKIAIVLRAFTDLVYLLQIIYFVLPTRCKLSIMEDLLTADEFFVLRKSLIQNILAVLPIPQIVILIFLPTTRNSRSLNRMKFLNSLILLQYVPRAYPMYRVCKDFNKETRERSKELARRRQIWIPGVLNFIMYFLASHVLGAFWYFFSAQREMDCWISACRSENGCNLSTLQCDNTHFRNVTLLNDLCPTNPPNPMAYDFGIFIDTLQSGIVGTTDFPHKLLMCFSWGLRNLSSFASNLNSSTYAWESVFVIFISISGLLLFMYLLGHVQIFMQAISKTSKISQRKSVICPQIKFMVSEYRLRSEIQDEIWELVREALEVDEDNPAANIFSLLPLQLTKHMKRYLFLATLRKLPGLENIDRQVLEKIMKHLEPVSYADGTYIIREGEPLDRMLFITQGIALAYKTGTTGGESGSSSTTHIAKGEVYGKELMAWAATSTPFSGLPISDQTVKSHEKVEVFAIRAARLKRIVSKFPTDFNTEVITTVEITSN